MAKFVVGSKVIIANDASKCGVMRNAIGTKGIIRKLQRLAISQTEIAEVETSDRTWVVTTNYLKLDRG